MEEELAYATVTFNTNSVSSHGKPKHSEVIYSTVKTEEEASNTDSVTSENEKKAPLSLLPFMAGSLGIICIILMSVVITLSVHMNTVTSEQERENVRLKRQKQELIRERDRLNWTIRVILEYENFPVNNYCPQKESNYSSHWMTWQESRNKCRNKTADLVVIESRKEQKFINNHTKYYHDDKHGYWIGLRKNTTKTWTWLYERNLTVMYWNTKVNDAECALSLPGTGRFANWQKSGCDMKNRWICERRAFIKPY
ncbi:NKG2-A/NKG2-B type II integral membrane protein-like isoform X2 [Anabas testudineus]|uniref:NKG2-A/NKG2-B type II integral membrane protein-like isoform X2 n=1 Tax=Anabas testudineus TaxID=64144 RepID=UPI000E45CBD0|nr:NKG2-A/NKG2-B type II integral membrane protein-like isoform X2 [Anabas testudineus]